MDNPETNGKSSSAPALRAGASKSPQPTQIEVDDSKAVAYYANFCRVMGTPEELLIDFGLNPEPFGVPKEPLAVSQRIVTNMYTAKRLMYVLQQTLQRHEATFGVIETNVQKRTRHD